MATLFEALEALGPGFMNEVRNRLAPVRGRFFPTTEDAQRGHSDHLKDGFYTAPPYLADPELRKVAIGLAELAIENGIDVNIGDPGGTTFLHYCVLLRDSATALETSSWLLAHGADANKVRNDGESPLSLAMKFGRSEIVALMLKNFG